MYQRYGWALVYFRHKNQMVRVKVKITVAHSQLKQQLEQMFWVSRIDRKGFNEQPAMSQKVP